MSVSFLLTRSEVVESHQRMSTNLRRVLDTAHLAERRRVGELLQEIRKGALVVRDFPPADEDFFQVEDFPDPFATMSRPLWQTPEFVVSAGPVEVEENVLALDELHRFRNLPQIRLQELRRNVESCLARDYTVALQQLLDAFPPHHGIMEVIGYLILATTESRHYVGEDSETIELPPPRHQRWRVPRVMFCKG